MGLRLPQALDGLARTREGGTSFSGARSLEEGVWKDGIRAGQTLFYRVPVDWGQQLDATAELGPASGDGYLGNALVMALHNPVRALVDDADVGYDGSRKRTGLEPLPPVAYENRFAVDDQAGGMRFMRLVLPRRASRGGDVGQVRRRAVRADAARAGEGYGRGGAGLQRCRRAA